MFQPKGVDRVADKKQVPVYAAFSRSQIKSCTQTNGKGMEKDISYKWKEKKKLV